MFEEGLPEVHFLIWYLDVVFLEVLVLVVTMKLGVVVVLDHGRLMVGINYVGTFLFTHGFQLLLKVCQLVKNNDG